LLIHGHFEHRTHSGAGKTGGVFYLVVYTWRGKTRHIITAWKVGKHGKKRYQTFSRSDLAAMKGKVKVHATPADAPEIDSAKLSGRKPASSRHARAANHRCIFG